MLPPPEQILPVLVALPGLLFLLLGLLWLLGIELAERTVAGLTCAVFTLITAACAWLGWSMLRGGGPFVWNGGVWFRDGEYEFLLNLLADRLSLPLMALTAVLVGLVGSFSRRYLHRESGFLRFFLLLNLFGFGSMLLFAAESFDLVIGGWELVGISSALLVGFFHERPDPARNALHVFANYRVGDLGLLLGVFVLHWLAGSAEDSHLFPGTWPFQASNVGSEAALLAGLLFLFAAAAKSAQVPFYGWLPRAMEGPTPSSAIFYGAISIHAGAYLLLRVEPVLLQAPVAAAAAVTIGLVSAIVGTMAHRAAADAKTSIAYAAMTQLGIVFVEIGLGFPRLALLHIVGHAVVRTLQFLRSPSMLHDYHRVHAAAGGHLGRTGDHFDRAAPGWLRLWAYRFALDRGFSDALVSRLAIAPVLRLSSWLASLEPGTRPVAPSLPTEPAISPLLQRTEA